MSLNALVIFVIAAVLLAAVSFFWILRPLWRERSQRTTTGIVVALLAVSAIALYRYTSVWTWPSDAAVADGQTMMVSRLARRLEREPDDVQGWLMLGRSHSALGQYPLAQRAYRRADRLESGRNAEAIIGIAEAMVLQADGVVDERSGRLFEQALVLEPDSEKALFFSAVAAQRRGETALAVARFEKILTMAPPENIRVILQKQVEQLRRGIPLAGAAESTSSASGMPLALATTAAEKPRVIVAVSVKPTLAKMISSGSTLFVFVRAPGRPGPPLAVKRLPAVFPVSVELTAADSMVEGVTFTANDTVEISAKVSSDGSATLRSGDPFGKTRYIVGRDFKKAVVIDGLTP
ncbi:MAG: tetratricopeptide repeat protein [Gammaproteobacteria bacterium]|nr:tetratricopeptide repeat protein [Gammaproteobacteria bacterium]